MHKRSARPNTTAGGYHGALLLACVIVFSSQVSGQSSAGPAALQRLTEQRQMLTAELDQYRKSLATLNTDGTAPEQSPNPAIRTLAIEAMALKQQLIAVTEQEVALLQQQVIANKANTTVAMADVPASATAAQPTPGNGSPRAPQGAQTVDSPQEKEAANVERLHRLLEGYYAELEESAKILPTAEELARRETAQRDAESLNKIPFSVDKVRLSGAEGSTALADISQRLVDRTIPESRRDIAPIAIIKTRLFDTLVSSENRSLKPVGKNHYIAKVGLQPGTTTISILSQQWEVELPQLAGATDYLVTLYRPVDGTPELHLFTIDDLLAADRPHIPAWLPEDLDIKADAKPGTKLDTKTTAQ